MSEKLMFAVKASTEVGDERLRSFHSLLTGELDAKCNLSNDPAVSYAVHRQSQRSRKKFLIADNASVLHERAVADFVKINELAGSVVPCLDPDIVSEARHFIVTALERFTRRSGSSAGPQVSLDLGLLLSLWRHGPGSSAGIRGTHFVDKLLSKKWTVTKRAKRLSELLITSDSRLNNIYVRKGVELAVVRGSRLSTVPKNEETRRTTAKEPLLNMALQLAAGMYIEGALHDLGLDLSTQPEINKLLAEVGSLSNGLATLDLKSASDLIVPALIKLLWPSSWYELFQTIRSEEIFVPGVGWTVANMVSTMGNGFTFPMMTLTLLSLVYACQSCREHRSMYYDRSTTAVFGDDIIIPVDDYDKVVSTLHSAGLLVNLDKSFSEGPFRESCGGDYYNGYNVTPVYIKSLRSDPEIYIAINRLLDWSARHRILLSKTFEYLCSILSVDKPFLVPVWETPFSGVQTYQVGRRYKKWLYVPSKKMVEFDHIDPDAAILISVGGYVTSTVGSSCFVDPEREPEPYRITYMPRPKNVRYKEELARLPRGRLDGRGPQLLRSSETERYLSTYIDIVLYMGANTREGLEV